MKRGASSHACIAADHTTICPRVKGIRFLERGVKIELRPETKKWKAFPVVFFPDFHV